MKTRHSLTVPSGSVCPTEERMTALPLPLLIVVSPARGPPARAPGDGGAKG